VSEGWTEIKTTWKDPTAYLSQNEAGGTVQMGMLDGKPGIGPMQLLLSALSGCTAMDIVSILQKKHRNLTDLQVNVRGKRATEFPMIWTDIHVEYLIWSMDVSPKDAEQAIKLSAEKYCSVELMLAKSAKITSDYQILKPGQSAA
jgi:putative redox protein